MKVKSFKLYALFLAMFFFLYISPLTIAADEVDSNVSTDGEQVTIETEEDSTSIPEEQVNDNELANEEQNRENTNQELQEEQNVEENLEVNRPKSEENEAAQDAVEPATVEEEKNQEEVQDEKEQVEEEEIKKANAAVAITSLKVQPYSDGDKGNHVVELKEKLVQLGFAKWKNPSPFYGDIAAKVVREFQDYYDLPTTGVANEVTRNKINQVLNPPFQNGDRGEPIVKLKKDLVKLGFAKWKNPSPFYGSVTASVVKDFQKANGLTADGIAGERTLAKMDELIRKRVQILSEGISNGDSGDHVVALKESLVTLGFAKWKNPSPFYGKITAGVVKDFQEYYELPTTGVADRNTIDKMKNVLNPPYQNGDRGKPIVQLKENLVSLGFAKWKNPSQFYGNVTANVVKDFQRANQLTVDGIAGQQTLSKIEQLLDKTIKISSSGQEVVALKEDLVALGFAKWKNPSPYFGKITAGVVKDFQSYYDLPVSGIADYLTLNKIDEVLNPPYQSGDRGKPIVALKEKLVKLGFAKWKNPSPFYGSVTAKVVKDFQREFNLPVTGIVNQATLTKMDDAIENGRVKLFLDPGHGGKDSGATGHGLEEKDIVLDIALKTGNVLLNNYLNVDIKYSRTTDKAVDLYDRPKMANNWGADYFVSFHNNSASSSAAKGFESFIYDGSVSKETKDRQKDMHQYLANRIDSTDRGAKRADFAVLRESEMPAILIEYLFISNYTDNSLLKKATYRDYLARITAEALAYTFDLKKK